MWCVRAPIHPARFHVHIRYGEGVGCYTCFHLFCAGFVAQISEAKPSDAYNVRVYDHVIRFVVVFALAFGNWKFPTQVLFMANGRKPLAYSTFEMMKPWKKRCRIIELLSGLILSDRTFFILLLHFWAVTQPILHNIHAACYLHNSCDLTIES